MRILVQSFSATLHKNSKTHPHLSGADMHYPHKHCDGGASRSCNHRHGIVHYHRIRFLAQKHTEVTRQ